MTADSRALEWPVRSTEKMPTSVHLSCALQRAILAITTITGIGAVCLLLASRAPEFAANHASAGPSVMASNEVGTGTER